MLKALFYPDVPFKELYIPWIYKEAYMDNIYVDVTNGKTDMICVDVGANIGIITDYLRPYSQKVYAIEPSNEHFEALKKNKEFNGWDNVEIFKLAIADKDGKMTLNTNKYNRTCHSLINQYMGGSDEEVDVMRFDTFLEKNNIEKVDFCKFDVEGAEDMILRSESFISVCKKFLAIEVEMHYETWPQLVEHMIKLGFKARRLDCSAIVVLFYQ